MQNRINGASHDPFAHFVHEEKGAYVGRHFILDMWGVMNHRNEQMILHSFEHACRDIGAQVMFSHVHPFGPDAGTTGVVILAESHLTWHHYPEVNFIAVDVFVCGQLDPSAAAPRLVEFWQPTKTAMQDCRRGVVEDRARYLAGIPEGR